MVDVSCYRMGRCVHSLSPYDHICVTSTESEAAAAVRIGPGLALRKRNELPGLPRPCYAPKEPWLQVGKEVSALVSELPGVSG